VNRELAEEETHRYRGIAEETTTMKDSPFAKSKKRRVKRGESTNVMVIQQQNNLALANQAQ
jgi:hypothetical protein